MCAILQPWVFALTGVFLTIVSVILGGYLVSVKQKQKLKAEDERIQLQTVLDKGFRQMRDAESKYGVAELLLAIIRDREMSDVRIGMPADVIFDYNARVAQMAVDAIANATSAITGDRPGEEQMEGWMKIIEEARAGDQSYFLRLSKIYNDLPESYAKHHNALAANRDRLKAKESHLDVSIEKIRYSALGLQIIGLIMVLIKDLLKG